MLNPADVNPLALSAKLFRAMAQGDGLSICSAPEPWRCFYWGVKNAYDSHLNSPWEVAKLQSEWFATYGEY